MELNEIAESIRTELDAKTAARDVSLSAGRNAIRSCGNAIRAMHRYEFDVAKNLIDDPVALRGRELVGGCLPGPRRDVAVCARQIATRGQIPRDHVRDVCFPIGGRRVVLRSGAHPLVRLPSGRCRR